MGVFDRPPMAMPGQIGHFHVLSELGRGGMGVVYKVKDTRTGQLAALKMVPPEALARADSALRFKREFRAMLRVQHPNVVRVFDAGSHDGSPFFTMEFVEGRDIRRWLDGDDPIVPSGKDPPPTTVLSEEQRQRLNDPGRVKRLADVIVQVAFALAEIHSHRIVHRDLKPDNILVNKADVAKLMDFGIAKHLTAGGEHSSGGMVVGTFKYLSPEQALGGDIDGRADLYCLGIIFYELLAGRHPFYSENSVGYAYHHARKAPPDIARFNPEVHPGLKAVCERLIKKDPRERFATAEDVIAALREAMNERIEDISGKNRRLPGAGRRLPFELSKDQIFQPSLVGRNAELRTFQAAAEQLLLGSGSSVIVTGPPGIGKSRLIREAAAEAKSRNIEYLVGRCEAQGSLPYQPYLEILDQLIEQVGQLEPDQARRILGDEGRVLARYLPAIERMPPEVRPRQAAALEPQGERLRFVSAVTTFLGRCAAVKPRVLVLDGLHKADELSIGLTQHLMDTLARGDQEASLQRGSPVVLAVALDPADEHAADARALLGRLADRGAKAGSVVLLRPLRPDEVLEMVASMLGGGEVAPALADFLHAETAGVPAAVEEQVRAWVEGGELRRKGRQWVFSKKQTHKPESAQGAPVAVDEADDFVEVRSATRADLPVAAMRESAAHRRVGRLSPVARDVAERLAVIGERAPGTLLERVALRSEDELLDALDELIKRGILVEEKGDAGFRFAEGDDRKSLIQNLKADRGRQLHLLVARAIEDDSRSHHRSINAEEQAHHFLQAGETVRAIEHLMIAARTALSASATQTAAQRVREAQELLAVESKATILEPQLARVDAELVLLRLDVLAAVNEHKECVALAKRRLPRLQGLVDGRLLAEVLLRLAASERVLGDLDAALEHTGQVLSRTERGGAHGLRCRAKALTGQVYDQRGQFELAERYYTDALELARAIGDELEEEGARWSIASRRLIVGDLAAAQREFERLLQQADARGEKLRLTQYVNALGIIAHEQARYDDAEVAYRRVIELARPAGDRRSLALALNNVAVVRRDQQRFDDALALTAKAGRIFADLDQVEHLAYVRIVEAQIHLERAALSHNPNDDEVAGRKADEALDLGLKANAALKVAEAALARGLAACRRGDLSGRDDVLRGLHAARTLHANRVTLYGELCEMEVRELLNDRAGAVTVFHEALARAQRTGFLRFVQKLDATATRLEIR